MTARQIVKAVSAYFFPDERGDGLVEVSFEVLSKRNLRQGEKVLTFTNDISIGEVIDLKLRGHSIEMIPERSQVRITKKNLG